MQQVTLCRENAAASQGLQFTPKAATTYKCLERPVALVKLKQAIKCRKQGILVVVADTGAENIDGSSSIVLNFFNGELRVVRQ